MKFFINNGKTTSDSGLVSLIHGLADGLNHDFVVLILFSEYYLFLIDVVTTLVYDT